eukprot:1185136-Prorocentrum_minimum.AAC.6
MEFVELNLRAGGGYVSGHLDPCALSSCPANIPYRPTCYNPDARSTVAQADETEEHAVRYEHAHNYCNA